MCDSTCVCIYHGFSQFLFVWFVYLCALHLFVCHFCLPDCCRKKQRKIGLELEGWRGGEDLKGDESGETIIRIYCIKVAFYYFLKKE